MKVKKLELEVDEENVEKNILRDIFREVSYAKKFLFFGGGKKHTDYRERGPYAEFFVPPYDPDHIDHSEYSENRHSETYTYTEQRER